MAQGGSVPRHNWHALSRGEVLYLLRTDPERGLSPREAFHRWKQWGPNLLPEKQRPGVWQMFVGQFQDVMILVLLGATGISVAMGEYVDALVIMSIVLLNAVLGLIQEFRAERSLELLKELAAPQGTVIRDGTSLTLAAVQIVPGDIVQISPGDKVPADIRLLESFSIESDESALTGESLPVAKDHQAKAAPGVLVGDRRNMVHMGTVITRGRGVGVVVATGSDTEIGQIAQLIHEAGDEATPLQKRLAHLGGLLVKACLFVCLLVFVLGALQGRDWTEMFLTGVSLAVAAIPEGLPAVVTISLALGVQRMIKRKAIVRKLSAVETLGCTTVICSDKTGTLTKNEMTVSSVYLTDGSEFRVSGEGFSPEGQIETLSGKAATSGSHPNLQRLVEIMAICNNAQLSSGEKTGKLWQRMRLGRHWYVKGDPTEGALLVFARKFDYDYQAERGRIKLISEMPFDSERKRMSVVVNTGARELVYAKGALDVLVDRAAYYLSTTGPRPLTGEIRKTLVTKAEAMSSSGLRVLAAAYREKPLSGQEPETDLILVGIVGMVDPPRPEVAGAISLAYRAGIRTLMVTGDHKLTALAVGKQIGLVSGRGEDAITGRELDGLTDTELEGKLRNLTIFARVSPEHKIRLVRLLRKTGEIVAMTGDGVNDAPAIKEADIGIAMGESGTDVAKEASAMVLSDDNYATIVAAIEEGRGIFENIRKFIRYLLGCNTGEVLTMLLATALNLPLPLVAVQILLMNLVTDGLPAIALSVDPVNPRVMERRPRPVTQGIFSGGLLKTILVQGTLIALGTIGVFFYSLLLGTPLITARTMAFSTLVLSQLLYVFRCRGTDSRGFLADLISNPFLTGAVLASMVLHFSVMSLPAFQRLFQVTALSLEEWGIILGVAIFVSWVEDIALETAIAINRNIRKVLGVS